MSARTLSPRNPLNAVGKRQASPPNPRTIQGVYRTPKTDPSQNEPPQSKRPELAKQTPADVHIPVLDQALPLPRDPQLVLRLHLGCRIHPPDTSRHRKCHASVCALPDAAERGEHGPNLPEGGPMSHVCSSRLVRAILAQGAMRIASLAPQFHRMISRAPMGPGVDHVRSNSSNEHGWNKVK